MIAVWQTGSGAASQSAPRSVWNLPSPPSPSRHVVANCVQVKAAVRSFEISLRCSSFSPQSFALRGPLSATSPIVRGKGLAAQNRSMISGYLYAPAAGQGAAGYGVYRELLISTSLSLFLAAQSGDRRRVVESCKQHKAVQVALCVGVLRVRQHPKSSGG